MILPLGLAVEYHQKLASRCNHIGLDTCTGVLDPSNEFDGKLPTKFSITSESRTDDDCCSPSSEPITPPPFSFLVRCQFASADLFMAPNFSNGILTGPTITALAD